VHISFRVKGDLLEHLNNLIHHIMTNDLDETYLAVDVLDSDLFKLSTTTNISYENTHGILKDIKHSLTHFITPRRRTKRLYEQARDLIDEISAEKEDVGDVKSRLIAIYEDIHENYETVCATGDINYFNSLCNNLMMLHEFSSRMKEYEMKTPGSDIYTKYIQMMKDVGVCRATLPLLSPQKIGQGGKPWIVRVDAVKTLSGNFQRLYSSVGDLLTAFDKPPSDKKDDGSDQSGLGIDDEQLEVKRADAVHYIVKMDWSIAQTARHLNMTVEELTDLLELGVGG